MLRRTLGAERRRKGKLLLLEAALGETPAEPTGSCRDCGHDGPASGLQPPLSAPVGAGLDAPKGPKGARVGQTRTEDN